MTTAARVAVLVLDLEAWLECEEKPFDNHRPQEWLDEFDMPGAIRELKQLVTARSPLDPAPDPVRE